MDERPPTRTGGFSLLELILVLLIMSVILAMTAPTFRGFAASRQVNDAASSIVSLIKWARMQAASEGRPYRLNVDIDLGEYWLTAQVGPNFEELRKSMGQIFSVPQEIILRWQDSNRAEQYGYIQFEPDGRAEPATIRLIGKLGTVVDVTCTAPSERFWAVQRPEEEYRYE